MRVGSRVETVPKYIKKYKNKICGTVIDIEYVPTKTGGCFVYRNRNRDVPDTGILTVVTVETNSGEIYYLDKYCLQEVT